MGAKPRSVGRPSKNTLRVELRLNADDEVTKALLAEAERRHVTLQQHIQDILTARHLGTIAPQLPAEPEPPAAADSAAASAEQWM